MLKPGMILCDRYEILEVVGAGGMSIVYKARCHRLNRNVAIKVLKPEFSNDKNFVTKFRIEAQASAGLSHPNIVNVYDVYDDDGIYFFVMELVDGITLKEYIAQNGRLSMDLALDFSIQIASGLEAAHEGHIIHRDIKPQNIIVSKNGNVKVTDFGIAKAATSNTLTSGAMGSVHYISPEQARGGYSDERSDIYSLGITMYEMVTGRVPFEGDNNVSVALMHIQSEMIQPRQYYPDIYSSFEKVIMKATQKKPERRYLTASALIADLKRVKNNPNIDIVVAPTSITNSPTQEWTKEDVQAIRDGSALKDPYDNSQLNAFNAAAYNTPAYGYVNTPVPNNMSEMQPMQQGGLSTIPVNNQKINQLFQEEEDWEDDYEEEEVYEKPQRKSSVKKIQDYEEEEYDEDDGEIDPSIRKAVTIAGIAAAVVIGIIVLVILGNVMGWFKPADKDKKTTEASSTEEEAAGELVMIDVYGYMGDAAKDLLESMGFTNVKISVEINNDIQEGLVFGQNYAKGDVVPVDAEIIIQVSGGAELLTVPDVTGYEDAQAVTLIKEAGFEVSHAYDYSEEVEKDKVISQDPVGNSQAAAGSTVTIVVSNGSEKQEVKIPNLSNLTEAEAIAAIEGLKLTVGTISEEYSDTVEVGRVISQNPVQNTDAVEGDVVDFVISKGPEPKETTYAANISATITYNGGELDGQAVTILINFNGETINTVTSDALVAGYSVNVSGTKSALTEQSGAAEIVIKDGAGNVVTSSFSISGPSTSYVIEEG